MHMNQLSESITNFKTEELMLNEYCYFNNRCVTSINLLILPLQAMQ